MSVRARRLARRSNTQFHARQIRARADAVAALLALPYLDADEAAFVAQTSPSTIRRACSSEGGTLPHIRVNNGKLIRIAPDDLRGWLRAGCGLQQAG